MGRRRLSKKAKLSHAAWRIFQKNGYENTTVEDILKESRVSKGTFYHYFDGKADLLNTLSVLFDDAYEEYQAEMTPDMSASEALLGSNQYLFRLIEEEVPANLMASLFAEQIRTDHYQCLQDRNRMYFQFVREQIERGLASGEFRTNRTAEELIALFADLERGAIYNWLLKRERYSLTEAARPLVEELLDGFQKGRF